MILMLELELELELNFYRLATGGSIYSDLFNCSNNYDVAGLIFYSLWFSAPGSMKLLLLSSSISGACVLRIYWNELNGGSLFSFDSGFFSASEAVLFLLLCLESACQNLLNLKKVDVS